MSSTHTQAIILASSSPYRREVLGKLGLAFSSDSPNIDESTLKNEAPEALVARLALAKAEAVAIRHSNSLIISSDQVAVIDGEIITKPGDHPNAVEQLKKASGREVVFLTSLCLLNAKTGDHQLTVSPFIVYFLELTDNQIENYLHKEQPYHCAGSFKSEGLGITLFSKLAGDDPNTLIGLPLIELTKMLRNEGVEPLSIAG